MNLKLSFVNVFLSPVAVGAALHRARGRKLQDFFHQGVAVYCPAEHAPLMKEALDRVAAFFGGDWVRYRKDVKRIILDDELQTLAWVARKTIIINESDAARMDSVVLMAGGLLYDYERIHACRSLRCGVIVWNRAVPEEARQKGLVLRKRFLSEQ